MGRKGDKKRLDDICDEIKRAPGEKPGSLARRLGVDNKTMMRALTQLESRGDLLAEDDEGRLLWVGQRSDS